MKDKFYKRLKSQIIIGSLEPNMHLNEAELPEALNISRPSRRDVLNIQKKVGFITIAFRKRASISENPSSSRVNYWEPFDTLPGLKAGVSNRVA
jgi:DNA-binding GntR family transcriptional regulator